MWSSGKKGKQIKWILILTNSISISPGLPTDPSWEKRSIYPLTPVLNFSRRDTLAVTTISSCYLCVEHKRLKSSSHLSHMLQHYRNPRTGGKREEEAESHSMARVRHEAECVQRSSICCFWLPCLTMGMSPSLEPPGEASVTVLHLGPAVRSVELKWNPEIIYVNLLGTE